MGNIEDQQLLDKYKKWAYKLAYKYGKVSTLIDFDDVVSIAQMAIFNAQDSYDPKKGVKLSTHTMNIMKYAVLSALARSTHLNASQENRIGAVNIALKELGDDATPEQISQYMVKRYKHKTTQLSPQVVKNVIELKNIKVKSFDQMLADNAETGWKLPFVDSTLEDDLDEKFRNKVLNDSIKKLNDKQQTVIKLRLQDKTLQEIADVMLLSRERIRQIEVVATTRLKRFISYAKPFKAKKPFKVKKPKKVMETKEPKKEIFSKKPQILKDPDMIYKEEYLLSPGCFKLLQYLKTCKHSNKSKMGRDTHMSVKSIYNLFELLKSLNIINIKDELLPHSEWKIKPESIKIVEPIKESVPEVETLILKPKPLITQKPQDIKRVETIRKHNTTIIDEIKKITGSVIINNNYLLVEILPCETKVEVQILDSKKHTIIKLDEIIEYSHQTYG